MASAWGVWFQIMELSDRAIMFLTDWFAKLDPDKIGGVRESKIISEMDETTPERIWEGTDVFRRAGHGAFTCSPVMCSNFVFL